MLFFQCLPQKTHNRPGAEQIKSMFALGIIFFALGFFLAAFNERLAMRFWRRRYHPNVFLYSVPRQNIAVIGGAFLFGGFLMLYLN